MIVHDEAWFERFYGRHHSAVAAYCVRRVGSVDAADVVSQVFVIAWRRRADLPPADRELPWLYGVARRVLGHHWRSLGRAHRLATKAGGLPVDPQPLPETVAVESEEHELVRTALAELRPSDREVLMLTAWEGLTHAEVGDVLECSLAAVDKRVSRAKFRLAEKYHTLERSRSSPVSARRGGGAA